MAGAYLLCRYSKMEMMQFDQHTVNISKAEDLAYWSRVLNISPIHLIKAFKATGSNLLPRIIWFLKAEGMLPHHFEPGKTSY
ncbi:MAG: hypothetical protein K0Q66_82 [Chitinophagaceae bacterium]|nr:hypothetical protein [Chitinophagaceae bacterium]